jgi:hypothetical protein
MLKERAYIYRRLNLFGDVFIAGISFLIAMLARVYLETGSFVLSEHYRRYFWLIYIVMVMWPFLLNVNGIYPTNRLRTVKRATGIIIKSSLQGLFAILAFLFILRLQIVSRLIITGFSVIAAVFYILKESIVISLLRLARESGANLRFSGIKNNRPFSAISRSREKRNTRAEYIRNFKRDRKCPS